MTGHRPAPWTSRRVPRAGGRSKAARYGGQRAPVRSPTASPNWDRARGSLFWAVLAVRRCRRGRLRLPDGTVHSFLHTFAEIRSRIPTIASGSRGHARSFPYQRSCSTRVAGTRDVRVERGRFAVLLLQRDCRSSWPTWRFSRCSPAGCPRTRARWSCCWCSPVLFYIIYTAADVIPIAMLFAAACSSSVSRPPRSCSRLGLATKTHLIISLPFCTLPVAPRTAARTHRPL